VSSDFDPSLTAVQRLTSFELSISGDEE